MSIEQVNSRHKIATVVLVVGYVLMCGYLIWKHHG